MQVPAGSSFEPAVPVKPQSGLCGEAGVPPCPQIKPCTWCVLPGCYWVAPWSLCIVTLLALGALEKAAWKTKLWPLLSALATFRQKGTNEKDGGNAEPRHGIHLRVQLLVRTGPCGRSPVGPEQCDVHPRSWSVEQSMGLAR